MNSKIIRQQHEIKDLVVKISLKDYHTTKRTTDTNPLTGRGSGGTKKTNKQWLLGKSN